MILTDLSVKRPVLASVISILLIVLGLVSFGKLPLREYPNIDPPIVSIETSYRGASSSVVESRITQLIEDQISGVEGIRHISSSSSDGRSSVTIEFDIGRDIEAATNDVRERMRGEDAAGIHRDNDGGNRLQETGIAKTQVHQFGWTTQQDAIQGLAASGSTDMQVRRIILDHQNRRGHEIG